MELLVGVVAGLVSSIPMLGPVALLLMAAGAAGRLREGRALAAGAALAEGVHVTLVVLGLGPALMAQPSVAVGLRIASGAVLMALAALAWRSRARARAARADHLAEAWRERRPAAAFGLGVALVLPNPGFLVAWLAVATVLADRSLPAGGPLFVAGAIAGIALWFALLLGAAARWGPRLAARRPTALRLALALVLGAFGAWAFVAGLAAL
ncbi:MAG: LysE family transporter [Myxococcota bacterium]